MFAFAKSKKAPTVADLSARFDEINAEIARTTSDIDEVKRRVGAAMLTGGDLDAEKERLTALERDRDVLNAARAEAGRLLTEHRRIEDAAEGKRLRAKQRADCAQLDELFRQAADLIGEIVDGEQRLSKINDGVRRPLSRATSDYREANRLEMHAGHEAEQRRADLNHFTHDRKALVGRDYGSSALAEVLALVASTKDEG